MRPGIYSFSWDILRNLEQRVQAAESGMCQKKKKKSQYQNVASFRENYIEPTNKDLWLVTCCAALANPQNLSETSFPFHTILSY